MPIIKSIDWSIGPRYCQLDLDWQTLELKARFLGLIQLIAQLAINLTLLKFKSLPRLGFRNALEHIIINARAHNLTLNWFLNLGLYSIPKHCESWRC